jgi:hypothetical protein
MRKRPIPAHARTFGRFFRHIRRANPWHDFAECNRIARIQYGYMQAESTQARWRRWVRLSSGFNSRRCLAQDALVIAFIPGRRWPDGEISQDQWTAAVIHRDQLPHGRTTYLDFRTRAEAIEALEKHRAD